MNSFSNPNHQNSPSHAAPGSPAQPATTKASLEETLAAPRARSAEELSFSPDILGDGFGVHYLDMSADPDGETPVRCALVRYCPQEAQSEFYTRPALLFVHGMTDYFFQTHVAEFFHQAGFAVYALDMRKCGRAWQPGQTWHHVTSQSLYDEDLSITTGLLGSAHPTVVPVGHSTGGLDVTTWSARLHAAAQENPLSGEAELHSMLGAVVCNSPWYGLQFNAPSRFAMTYLLPLLGKIVPNLPLPEGLNPAYGHSLHADYAGEWEYDLKLKPIEPRRKYLSWLLGVIREIRRIQSGHYDTGLPTLVLTSDDHHFSNTLDPQTYVNDPILKPQQMWQAAPKISALAHIEVIPDATHDVFLSLPPVRARALGYTATWLKQQLNVA